MEFTDSWEYLQSFGSFGLVQYLLNNYDKYGHARKMEN